jgi:hypothetical protein
LDDPIVLVGAVKEQRALRVHAFVSVLADENCLPYSLGSLLVGHIVSVLLGSWSCGNESTSE